MFGGGERTCRQCDGVPQNRAVGGANRGLPDIGPVGGKRGGHFDESLVQLCTGEVPSGTIPRGQRIQAPRQGVHLAGEELRQRGALSVKGDLPKGPLVPGKAAVDSLELDCAPLVHEDAVDRSPGLVTGGSRHRPLFGQRLVAGEDLLHDDVASIFAAQPLLQRFEVGVGIVDPVEMIDAKAGDSSLRDEPQDQGVGRLEHRRVAHPDADQVGDVEEAAVVDLTGRQPPVAEPVGLRLDHLVEQVGPRRPAPG